MSSDEAEDADMDEVEEGEESEEGQDEESAEAMPRLVHGCFGSPPSWEAWNALVVGADRHGVDLAKLLRRPAHGQQELLDGSKLVRSSLGYEESEGAVGGISTMFQGEDGLEMFRMMTGRYDYTKEELQAQLAAATEAAAAKAAARAPRAASERVSEHSTHLSRFDAGGADSAAQPAADNLARWVLEARCEVHSDPVSQSPCWGYRHDFATNAMCLSEDSLALVGGHGYKASLGWVTVLNSQRQSPPSTLAEHAAAAIVAHASPDEIRALASDAQLADSPAERALNREIGKLRADSLTRHMIHASHMTPRHAPPRRPICEAAVPPGGAWPATPARDLRGRGGRCR